MKTCSKCKTTYPSVPEYFHKNKSTPSGFHYQCKFCMRASGLSYARENLEKLRQAALRWAKENPEKDRARVARRKAAKLRAMPSWLTDEQKKQIQEMYETCPQGHHVDHITPLQGGNVCGLHVPWNLQHLPATENLKKSNKVLDSI